MSRTKKGKKGPGYDYWSRRYGNDSKSNPPGRKTKNITNRAERRIARQSNKECHE